MKKLKSFKFKTRAKELVILVLFIAVTSFAIIEVKNLLNKENIKALTEQINFSDNGEDNNILFI